MNSVTNKKKLTSSKSYLIRALNDWIVDNMLTPYILVNAELPGVRVPRQYVKNGQIILNISPEATSHLEITLSKLQFRAGFGDSHFEVLLPIKAIEAIYAYENGQGMGFAMGIPGETGEDDDGDGDGGEELAFTESSSASGSPSAQSKAPFLKVVK